MTLNAIDLFSGCGGLTQGLKEAGFNVLLGIEIDSTAAKTYKINHQDTLLFHEDIRNFDIQKLKAVLKDKQLHLLAGCPPCQGFSVIKNNNKKFEVDDERNKLIYEFIRFINELNPLTVMLENVPALEKYYLFKKMVSDMKEKGYEVDYKVVDMSKYGIPQRRKRLVMIGSRIGGIKIQDGNNEVVTVRDTIGFLESTYTTTDPLHKIYYKPGEKTKKLISLIPQNGGSRRDLPEEYILQCHKKNGIGFSDVYGRLSWDNVASTLTSGCLNPSKGRFLHPEFNRSITAREAALLQTFPKDYYFPLDISKKDLSLLIGNAFPPKFSCEQAKAIRRHIETYLA